MTDSEDTQDEDRNIHVQHDDGELLLYPHEGMAALRYSVQVTQPVGYGGKMRHVWEAAGDNLALLMQQAGEAIEQDEPDATPWPRASYEVRIDDRLAIQTLDEVNAEGEASTDG